MAMAILYNSSYYVCLSQFSKAMASLYCYRYYVLLLAIMYGYDILLYGYAVFLWI